MVVEEGLVRYARNGREEAFDMAVRDGLEGVIFADVADEFLERVEVVVDGVDREMPALRRQNEPLGYFFEGK